MYIPSAGEKPALPYSHHPGESLFLPLQINPPKLDWKYRPPKSVFLDKTKDLFLEGVHHFYTLH